MRVLVQDVSVCYGQRKVLESIDLGFDAGQLTAIVGPNGSGKSTLIKTMCGDLPFDGIVSLNGVDVATAPAWKLASMRGVLPQASTLSFPFTAIEVVRIGLSNGTGGAQSSRAEAALARVGLLHHAQSFYQELSGGEQQRVQLARVLAQIWCPVDNGKPNWLLLDEPVSSLDISHQVEVMRLAGEFASRGGGVVAVMHDLNLTGLFADAVVVMREGKVLAFGQTRDVLIDEVLSEAYGCALRVGELPDDNLPFVLPHPALRALEADQRP